MRRALVVCFISILTSCSTRLSKAEYFNYFIQFHDGSYVVAETDQYIFQLQYRPAEFFALSQLRNADKITRDSVNKYVQEFNTGTKFCLRINRRDNGLVLDKSIDSEYFEKVAMLSVDFPYLAYGITMQDTSRCSFHHFERTYQIRPFEQIIYELDASIEDLDRVVFEDVLFSKQIIEFTGVNKLKENIPQLKI